jgi:hypothetical protein
MQVMIQRHTKLLTLLSLRLIPIEINVGTFGTFGTFKPGNLGAIGISMIPKEPNFVLLVS